MSEAVEQVEEQEIDLGPCNEILDKFEAGVALEGTEVKSVRASNISLNEGYISAREHPLWPERCHRLQEDLAESRVEYFQVV